MSFAQFLGTNIQHLSYACILLPFIAHVAYLLIFAELKKKAVIASIELRSEIEIFGTNPALTVQIFN